MIKIYQEAILKIKINTYVNENTLIPSNIGNFKQTTTYPKHRQKLKNFSVENGGEWVLTDRFSFENSIICLQKQCITLYT
jgi:hypothetical protein